jgi:ribulose 1,5-bisphosphate carboxylase large subunit-like protein
MEHHPWGHEAGGDASRHAEEGTTPAVDLVFVVIHGH